MCNGFVWGIVEGDRCRTICAERALKPSFRVIVGGSQRIGPSAKVSTAMNCLQRSFPMATVWRPLGSRVTIVDTKGMQTRRINLQHFFGSDAELHRTRGRATSATPKAG
jgi:hypothetical protein